MRINARTIVSEREKRAWSQQHLATVTGLALRTVQRVESKGRGSYETAQAIASCLEIPVADLRNDEPSARGLFARIGTRKKVGSAIAATLLAGTAVFSIQGVLAENVLLDVGITTFNGDDHVTHVMTQMLLEDGEESDLPMEGPFYLVIGPTVLEDGKVILAVKFSELQDDRYELLGEPRVITPSGEEVEIVIKAGEGEQRRYTIAITPQVQ